MDSGEEIGKTPTIYFGESWLMHSCVQLGRANSQDTYMNLFIDDIPIREHFPPWAVSSPWRRHRFLPCSIFLNSIQATQITAEHENFAPKISKQSKNLHVEWHLKGFTVHSKPFKKKSNDAMIYFIEFAKQKLLSTVQVADTSDRWQHIIPYHEIWAFRVLNLNR